MKAGDKVIEWVPEYTLYGGGTDKKVQKEGTVIYIHPRKRFYRVAFDCGRGNKIIESFLMEGGSE